MRNVDYNTFAKTVFLVLLITICWFIDQKLGGIAAGVFLGAHGPGFQKSPELHLQPHAKYPKFNPQTLKSG